MKIYTKTGDAGETGLFGGARVSKADPRIDAYGNVDELNSVLGWVLAEHTWIGSTELAGLRASLSQVQSELFQVGAELATPGAGQGKGGKHVQKMLITDAMTERLEREMDQMESELEGLKNFILPGGCEAAARLHLARTVSRRAERALVALHSAEPQRGEVLRYLNRLADHLFVSARFVNFKAGVRDVPWV